MSKDFFKRKQEKSKLKISEHGDYDVKNFDNDLHACGITDIEGFQARYKELFGNLIVDSSQENPVATVAKKIEATFSCREIAFLISKDLLHTAYEGTVEQLNTK